MQIFQNIYPLEASTLKAIEARAERICLKKDKLLIRAGSICDRLFFLESGSIKSFHSENGKHYTSWVYFEGEMLTSWHSYLGRMPSMECFKANEEASLLSLHREDVDFLKHQHIDFLYLLNSYYEFSIGFYDYFAKKSPNLSTLENYRFILENYPQLVQRASTSDIASIIGVSRETISRIRAQV
ncbi:MAG: cyclic nucleotide-binding domain-containing protein [Bacteroidota bacterium]